MTYLLRLSRALASTRALLGKVAALACASVVGGCTPSTTPIVDGSGKAIPGSVARLRQVRLGGLDQWILERGHDTRRPVLVYLHGGPGSSELPFVRAFGADLERRFVVVSWEQRGAGKTFRAGTDPRTMTIDRFLDDLHELVAHLKRTFAKEKVYLLGHSWGSALGMLYVSRHPEDCVAYAGTGQSVNVAEGERLSYEFTVRRARETGNATALKELAELGRPPYAGDPDEVLAKVTKQREWLQELGGTLYDKRNASLATSIVMGAPEYSLGDILAYPKAIAFSLKTVGPEYLRVNLLEQVPSVSVPVFFLQGRMDYTTPSVIVERYVEKLTAPRKELIWFDRSAHSPIFEEPATFARTLIERFESVGPPPR